MLNNTVREEEQDEFDGLDNIIWGYLLALDLF